MPESYRILYAPDRTLSLYMAFADVYNKVYNSGKEEEYVKKGIEEFILGNDLKHKNLSSGRLAIVYLSQRRWAEADSLFMEGLVSAREDTFAMASYLTNYARMKVCQDNTDPTGALDLLEKKVNEYKRPLHIADYGVYAYASCLSGDMATCDAIETQLVALDNSLRREVYLWLYLIEQHKGNLEKALEYNIESSDFDYSTVSGLLSHSVSHALDEFHMGEAEKAQRESRVMKLGLTVSLLAFILIILTVSQYARMKRERKDREIERLLVLKDNLLGTMDSYREQLELYNERDEKLQSTLKSLRESYAAMYKEKFAGIGELLNVYIDSNGRTDRDSIVFRHVESQIKKISGNGRLHTKFEKQINSDLNDIVEHLKEDLGITDMKESRFLCYCIVGFDNRVIAAILELSISNVYTKKSRLRDRIRRLDSPYKEDYIRMLC